MINYVGNIPEIFPLSLKGEKSLSLSPGSRSWVCREWKLSFPGAGTEGDTTGVHFSLSVANKDHVFRLHLPAGTRVFPGQAGHSGMGVHQITRVWTSKEMRSEKCH